MKNNRSTKRHLSRLVVAAVVAVSSVQYLPAADTLVTLQGHVPREIQSATLLGRAQADELVPLSLVVHVDDTLLQQTLDGIYSHTAPGKRHYLSSTEFAQRFDLATKRQALIKFAQDNGFTVDPKEDRTESMAVKVSAPVHTVEAAFHIQMNNYRTADGRLFRAHNTAPTVPQSIQPHLSAILGLSNLTGIVHPYYKVKAAGTVSPAISGGTGPGGALAPANIAQIYGLNSLSLTGSGQIVALAEFDGYTASDITTYEALFSLPNTPVVYIGVDGATNTPGGGAIEVALDIDMVLALASGVTQISVYNGPGNQQGVYDVYNAIATDNIAKVASSSWGYDEPTANSITVNGGTPLTVAENQVFQRMAAQGQSMYAASGDSGAYSDGTTVSADDPSSQPYVTGVGGTSLAGTLAAPVETEWNSCGTGKCLQGSGGSSGGGVSAVWPIPSYQVGITGQAGQTSQTMRNIPDVALNADPASGYAVREGGTWWTVGGTSAAAPLWAAFTAQLNQASLAAGSTILGFPNPTLYQLAGSASTYSTNFNDVTSGDNGFYTAGVGYDNTTGWGSFKGASLINSLSGILAILAKEQLLNVYAYPNPWDTRKYTVRQVTIANVPDDATIKIFTISGFWVRNLTASNNNAVWDLTNDHGDRVASGLYFYLVKTAVATAKGEIAIIK
jgi:kumamolisin